jgi:hypothetical protein
MKVRQLVRGDGVAAGIAQKDKVTEKVHLRFRQPKAIKNKLPAKMIEDGYGLKEKSLWIQDSIRELLQDKYWKPMALELMWSIGDTVNDGVYLTIEVQEMLDAAADELVEYADQEGRPMRRSVSSIIRAAITRRFIEGVK